MSTNPTLVSELERWASTESFIHPRHFDCKFYRKCNDHRVNLNHGNTCLMSYIGRRYGEAIGMGLPNLVIVGMNHGEADLSGTYVERRDQIESYSLPSSLPFRLHYQGVVKTAAAFLGAFGNRCGKICVKRCARSTGEPHSQCVLERFAQPNLVKCVSQNARNMSDTSTGTMRFNCSSHLLAEIRLLAPNLVVVHGSKEKDALLQALERHRIETTAINSITIPQKNVYYVPKLNLHVVFLLHPSHNWLFKTWARDAEPALGYLRTSGLISVE